MDKNKILEDARLRKSNDDMKCINCYFIDMSDLSCTEVDTRCRKLHVNLNYLGLLIDDYKCKYHKKGEYSHYGYYADDVESKFSKNKEIKVAKKTETLDDVYERKYKNEQEYEKEANKYRINAEKGIYHYLSNIFYSLLVILLISSICYQLLTTKGRSGINIFFVFILYIVILTINKIANTCYVRSEKKYLSYFPNDDKFSNEYYNVSGAAAELCRVFYKIPLFIALTFVSLLSFIYCFTRLN